MKPMPDMQTLRRLSDEVDELVESGRWSKAEFMRIIQEAGPAAAGDGDLLEFAYMEAQEPWLDELAAKATDKVTA